MAAADVTDALSTLVTFRVVVERPIDPTESVGITGSHACLGSWSGYACGEFLEVDHVWEIRVQLPVASKIEYSYLIYSDYSTKRVFEPVP